MGLRGILYQKHDENLRNKQGSSKVKSKRDAADNTVDFLVVSGHIVQPQQKSNES